MRQRRYPIGIQTFERIIKEGYVYVDKTDLVWKLTQLSPFVFLSRPRRFGKSLLSTTLESYFKGSKHLFERLKIMHLEKEWEKYPVIHLDLSVAKGKETTEELSRSLMLLLSQSPYFEGNLSEKTPGEKLMGMITRANAQTGKQVVVIIDEYDSPLLDQLHEKTILDDMRKVMQEFYQPLKANERFIKFCFITGITKFSQLSIFSTINNLKDVTLNPRFSAICGITEEEVKTCFSEEIESMAAKFGCSADAMFKKLKEHYDGYHFSEESEDIYNPFSILNAFDDQKIANYWFATGTPTFLIRQMQHFKTDITTLDSIEVPASAFDRPTEAMTTALPLLYQSGYLTIKDYDRDSQIYTLSIPNQEVRLGYAEGLLPTYIGLDGSDVQSGFALKFWRALKRQDIHQALLEMQTYFAGLPYIEGFKQKMGDATKAEGFYEWTFYLIFSMLNVYVHTLVKTIKGRADMVVWMPDIIYVFELKINGTAQAALDQVKSKGYAIPYQTDQRKVTKVGVRFSTETLNIEDWLIE